MARDFDYVTPCWTLVNGGTRYTVYVHKKTAAHGVSYLMKSPSGMWVVGNGVNIFSPFIGFECVGDWHHGHYFMDDRSKAIRYFESL